MLVPLVVRVDVFIKLTIRNQQPLPQEQLTEVMAQQGRAT
jgi:hypothetical protein